jgi:hypothetical protein
VDRGASQLGLDRQMSKVHALRIHEPGRGGQNSTLAFTSPLADISVGCASRLSGFPLPEISGAQTTQFA